VQGGERPETLCDALDLDFGHGGLLFLSVAPSNRKSASDFS
jgi:hypothetical protein